MKDTSLMSPRAVLAMSRVGFTAAEIAHHFWISRRTFFYRLSHDKILHLAFTKGRSEFQEKLLARLQINALKMGHRRSLVTLARQFGIGVERDSDWPEWRG